MNDNFLPHDRKIDGSMKAQTALVSVSGREGQTHLCTLSMQSPAVQGGSGEEDLREGSSKRISEIFPATIPGPVDVSIPWFNLKSSQSGELPGTTKLSGP